MRVGVWFQMKQGSPWQMERAVQTESACRTMRAALIESSLQMLKEKSRISAQCLPDTIDPLGPKGGGR